MSKIAYPIILSPIESGYLVYVPDFDINTSGKSIADAIDMACDAISLIGVDFLEDKKPIPKPSNVKKVSSKENEIVTLVNVDFEEYRKSLDTRSIRKNCSIPSWLNSAAEKQGINFSQTLQEALKQQLNL